MPKGLNGSILTIWNDAMELGHTLTHVFLVNFN